MSLTGQTHPKLQLDRDFGQNLQNVQNGEIKNLNLGWAASPLAAAALWKNVM